MSGCAGIVFLSGEVDIRLFLTYLIGCICFIAVCVAWALFGEGILRAYGASDWIIGVNYFITLMVASTYAGWFARGMMRARASQSAASLA